jgi:hypothetical protein
MKTHWRTLAILGGVLLSPLSASASALTFQCTLTETETINQGSQFSTDTERRSIHIQVDEAEKRISVYQDGHSEALRNVVITQIAMTGYTEKLSIGIQRSSLNVVLQSYEPNRTKAEFGLCQSAESAPSKLHQ